MADNCNNIFISHRSTDADVADMIKDFLVNTGIPNNRIFCSSLPGNDINEIIGSEVKKHLKEAAIIILILSQDYYKSPYCLNEAGVAWYLDETLAIPFGFPEINPNNMLGFFNSEYKLRRLDADEDIAYLFDQAQKHLEIANITHSVITQESRKLKERYRKYISERAFSEDIDETEENDEEMYDGDDIFENGYHEVKDSDGKILKKGIFENGHLIDGTEYDMVLKIAKGDSDKNFEDYFKDGNKEEAVRLDELGTTKLHYTELGQYRGILFLLSGQEMIEELGLQYFYVADKHIKMDGKKIVPTFKNLRTLEDFLAQNEPDTLEEIKTGEIKYEEIGSAFFETND